MGGELELDPVSRKVFDKCNLIGGTTLKKLVLIFCGNRMVYHDEV